MQTKFLLIFTSFLFFVFSSPITLKVEIDNLKNSKGQVLLELSDAEKNSIKGVSQKIENNKCTIIINALKPGQYTFKYFHDENSNKKLDTNFIGIPKEGFGFSNNAKISFGPPSHQKTIFELNNDTTLNCAALYLKK